MLELSQAYKLRHQCRVEPDVRVHARVVRARRSRLARPRRVQPPSSGSNVTSATASSTAAFVPLASTRPTSHSSKTPFKHHQVSAREPAPRLFGRRVKGVGRRAGRQEANDRGVIPRDLAHQVIVRLDRGDDGGLREGATGSGKKTTNSVKDPVRETQLDAPY